MWVGWKRQRDKSDLMLEQPGSPQLKRWRALHSQLMQIESVLIVNQGLFQVIHIELCNGSSASFNLLSPVPRGPRALLGHQCIR